VQGPVGGEAVVTIGRDTPPDAIEIRIGRNSYVPAVAESDGGGPLLHANQILDGDFVEGLSRWRSLRQPQGWALGVDHPGWALRGSHTAFMRQDVAEVGAPMELVYDSGLPGGLIPLQPCAHYQVSGLFGSHRCRGELGVRVIDTDGAVLGTASLHPSPAFLGGEEISGYHQVVVDFVAPDQSSFAQVFLSKGATEGGTDSWFFFTRLSFARVASRSPLGFRPCPFPAEMLGVLQRLDVSGLKQIRIALPPDYDAVEVVQRATGLPLPGSPLRFKDRIRPEGAITGLQGTSIVGWARDAGNPSIPLRVRLFVDGREHTSALADRPHGESRSGFRLPLPTEVLDGEAHWISVRIPNDQSVAETAEILPAAMTPWAALSRYGSVRLPARLSTAASYRYEALREHVEALARAGAKGSAAEAALAGLSQLTVAHERVLAGIDRKLRVLPPLAFPMHETPKVSIVIPVHNKLDVTHNCLAALVLAYNAASFEVIIADDGSSDGTSAIEELVSGITVVRNGSAEGFISACNLGASKARGEYVVLLNNDTEPTARWLDELIHCFENFDRVGLVGSKLLYPDGRLQEAGAIIWGSGNAWNYGRLGNAADPKYNYTRQADYVSGAALMIPTALWKQVGGLSEDLRPAYWEDTDLAFKVRETGHRVLYAPLSVVFHFEGVSNGTDTSSGMKRFQEVNRPKFLRKWRAAYRGNGINETPANAEAEKDRGIGLRALFIDAQTPRPDQDAGSYAAVQEIRAMQALGAKVTFLPDNLAYLGGYTINLQRAGVETIYAPFATSVENFLESRGPEFDVIYITRYRIAEKHIEAVRRHAPQAKVMFCNADLHFLRELREAVRVKDPEKMSAALATREAELRVMRAVDITLSYNQVEHAVILSHNLNSSIVSTAPWIVDVPQDIPGYEARSGIAFLGGFSHPPNGEAVQFFVREVMPLLRRRLPDAAFTIYGSSVPPEIEKLAANDVVVKGFVEDVADVFSGARVFVAPLLSGAGVKGKVVDALSFGVPSVLSPVAAEGIGLSEGSEAIVARNPAEWVDAIVTLYTDAAAWHIMSERARAYARRVYSFERGVEHMRAAVEAVGLVPDSGMAPKRARLGL
jgi:GT2 family glycosyltransferase/glycosyltransferase involved in cell wall biosynthesis